MEMWKGEYGDALVGIMTMTLNQVSSHSLCLMLQEVIMEKEYSRILQ
jgi:hypothetical protein